MSAICGICQMGDGPLPPSLGNGMLHALEKFQADQAAGWQQDGIFLGCRAQWIAPESIGERLPYYNEAKGLAITADALIDNRKELFEKLHLEGEIRSTLPDSVLILLAFEKWGLDVPKHLVGDFAFLIWDDRNRRLFGARDFSGNRTLYWTQTSEFMAFSTVIQPLFTLPGVQPQLNELWLAEFLANPGRIETMDPHSTVYRNVNQIPPSHSFTWAAGRLSLSRYCTFTDIAPLKLKRDEEYEEAFRSVFDEAVRSRLRTHHNVGSFLSGGLDSGTVVNFAAKALAEEQKRLRTFSYIPPQDFVDWTPRSRLADERPFIQETVRNHENIIANYMDFQGANPYSVIPDWLDTMEMPYKFHENSFWLDGIFKAAKEQGIGVLLNGGRGNHTISWGPANDYYGALLKKLRWVKLSRELRLYGQNKGIGRKSLVKNVAAAAFPWVNRFRDSSSQPMLINPAFASRTKIYAKLAAHGIHLTETPSNYHFLQERLNHFEKLTDWTNSGVTGTKISLRHGIWYRDPTNDLRVVRFCLSVPVEQYVRDGMNRALLRRSTAGLLPDKVRLNYRIRGIQGSDSVHRMKGVWDSFVQEADCLTKDTEMAELLNIPMMAAALAKFRAAPDPTWAYDAEYSMLMRGLIVYRFIRGLKGGDMNEQRMEQTVLGST